MKGYVCYEDTTEVSIAALYSSLISKSRYLIYNIIYNVIYNIIDNVYNV